LQGFSEIIVIDGPWLLAGVIGNDGGSQPLPRVMSEEFGTNHAMQAAWWDDARRTRQAGAHRADLRQQVALSQNLTLAGLSLPACSGVGYLGWRSPPTTLLPCSAR
jgi:hypothetical protein